MEKFQKLMTNPNMRNCKKSKNSERSIKLEISSSLLFLIMTKGHEMNSRKYIYHHRNAYKFSRDTCFYLAKSSVFMENLRFFFPAGNLSIGIINDFSLKKKITHNFFNFVDLYWLELYVYLSSFHDPLSLGIRNNSVLNELIITTQFFLIRLDFVFVISRQWDIDVLTFFLFAKKSFFFLLICYYNKVFFFLLYSLSTGLKSSVIFVFSVQWKRPLHLWPAIQIFLIV